MYFVMVRWRLRPLVYNCIQASFLLNIPRMNGSQQVPTTAAKKSTGQEEKNAGQEEKVQAKKKKCRPKRKAHAKEKSTGCTSDLGQAPSPRSHPLSRSHPAISQAPFLRSCIMHLALAWATHDAPCLRPCMCILP